MVKGHEAIAVQLLGLQAIGPRRRWHFGLDKLGKMSRREPGQLITAFRSYTGGGRAGDGIADLLRKEKEHARKERKKKGETETKNNTSVTGEEKQGS